MKIGLDIGSTTLKCTVLDSSNNIIYSNYVRHFSQIAEKTSCMLKDISLQFPGEEAADICIAGSAGMGLAEDLGIPFIQEVHATSLAVRSFSPEIDTVIELGGEDAKILFLSGMTEVRMNGSCAGGTGSFIDQMATLLNITPDELNDIASESSENLSIASRCGVFAKSDIQALLNQGARKPDIARGIFYAVVSQTVAGLSQGREISGNVLYLGGPLTFLSQLRLAFDDVLGVRGICPENSLFFVAAGAALSPMTRPLNVLDTAQKIADYSSAHGYRSTAPLFASMDEYNEFVERHKQASVPVDANLTSSKRAYIGIDAGSTTVKAVAINDYGDIIFSRYVPNSGNPVPIVKDFLIELYGAFPDIKIMGSTATGYGEDIIKNAFRMDSGVVETVAHYTAARAFDPNVDFIIDIGGQDIKCFKIRNGAIDNIFLNEACSSGCGSFLQSFAGALGYNTAEFSALGLFAEQPVDLGSRCTVFMNSSVKQAQKDGADISSISAGLSVSVVKNALYKVIRAAQPSELGKNIVVQGGTFLNDAVLRSFEQETGRLVTRPTIAGLMGAFGSAIYAMENSFSEESSIISLDELKSFKHEVAAVTCNGCTNRCSLTVNTFGAGHRFIAGNRCEKPVTGKAPEDSMNLYEYKLSLLSGYKPVPGTRGKIGIPMGLNMMEMLPFWHAFFTRLGFEVFQSPGSTRELYFTGQHTIPSDTVCYPAKLIHGHIEALAAMDLDAIFYPCMTYNIDEGLGDNCFNCPVVAYYPEVIDASCKNLHGTKFIFDYIGIHKRDSLPKKIRNILAKYFPKIALSEIRSALNAAFAEYDNHLEQIRAKGKEYMETARERDLPVLVLSGRPYHVDKEINHGIDQLITSFGAVLISEDAISHLQTKFPTTVLNQWTYHARMYAAARYIADSDDMKINLIQLVSFGCGVDAVTSDEVRSILESKGRIYTQIKIDEIANLGAVKIRIRSLFSALENQNGGKFNVKAENKRAGLARIYKRDEGGLHNPHSKYGHNPL